MIVTMVNALKLNEMDNVAVLLKDAGAGEKVVVEGGKGVRALEFVKAGHKVAVKQIDAGTPVFRYGEEIGAATETIAPGTWVHTHNVRSQRMGDLE